MCTVHWTLAYRNPTMWRFWIRSLRGWEVYNCEQVRMFISMWFLSDGIRAKNAQHALIVFFGYGSEKKLQHRRPMRAPGRDYEWETNGIRHSVAISAAGQGRDYFYAMLWTIYDEKVWNNRVTIMARWVVRIAVVGIAAAPAQLFPLQP